MSENERMEVVVAEFKRKAFAMMVAEIFKKNNITARIDDKSFSGDIGTHVGLGDGGGDAYFEIVVGEDDEQNAIDLLDEMKSYDAEMFNEDINFMDILDTDNWKSIIDVDVQATAEVIVESLKEHHIPATIREDYSGVKKKPFSIVVHPEDRDEAKDLLNRFEHGEQ